jgi:hypothetical protein
MPLPPDVVPLVREFANNGFRYLFHQPDNIADLLRWREPKIARGIDFTQMAAQPETFIAPSFAQMELDFILGAPFRICRGKGGSIEIFILIEHLCDAPPNKSDTTLACTMSADRSGRSRCRFGPRGVYPFPGRTQNRTD